MSILPVFLLAFLPALLSGLPVPLQYADVAS